MTGSITSSEFTRFTANYETWLWFSLVVRALTAILIDNLRFWRLKMKGYLTKSLVNTLCCQLIFIIPVLYSVTSNFIIYWWWLDDRDRYWYVQHTDGCTERYRWREEEDDRRFQKTLTVVYSTIPTGTYQYLFAWTPRYASVYTV